MFTLTIPSAITDLQHEIQNIWADNEYSYYGLFIALDEDGETEVFCPLTDELVSDTLKDLRQFDIYYDDDALFRTAFALALECEKQGAIQNGLEVC